MKRAAAQHAQRNTTLAGFRCLRCEAQHPIADYDLGCPRCAREGYPANVAAYYNAPPGALQLPYRAAVPRGDGGAGENGLGENGLSEGGTPCIDLPGLADAIGVGRLSAKLEWCNPTGSHKDRMSAQLVQRACDTQRGAIVAASSGNAGLSIASYAARFGIPAEIVVTEALPEAFREAIAATGATLTVAVTSLARWDILDERVRQGAFAATNYARPAVGTNAFGVEGYKMLAAEIAAGAAMPDIVVAPTARGDLISGLYLGFGELGGSMPRLVAAEPFPRLSKALAGADYRGLFEGSTAQFSIAGATTTFQALHAVRETKGCAVPVSDRLVAAAARDLARYGLHAEGAAAAALVAATELASGGDLRGRHVLLVLTGSSFREPRASTNLKTAIKPTGRDSHADHEKALL